MLDQPTDSAPRPKADKIEIVKVLVLALASFVLGFGLVIFFLGPGESSKSGDMDFVGAGDKTDIVRTAEEAPAEDAVDKADESGYAPGGDANPLLPGPGAEAAAAGEAASPEEAVQEGDAPVEVPPGRTPDGVGIKGDAFYLKCWDKDGGEVPGTACDKLPVLEKRFGTRLYVVDRCKQTHSGQKSEGKLSLGLEVDFDARSVSFWNGASSEIENADKVAMCLRTELLGLPIHSVDHKYSKYRMFFTVVFGKASLLLDAEKKPAGEAAEDKTEKAKDKPALAALPSGKLVKVVMDKVRVRKTPLDGEIIGKISSGNEVKLLGKKGEWCEVLTPNNNRGWMTCDALSK